MSLAQQWNVDLLQYSLVVARAEGEEAGQRVEVERRQRERRHVVAPERLRRRDAGRLQAVVRRVVGHITALHL